MATLSITPANVQPGSGIVLKGGECGSTAITAGMAIYKDSGNSNELTPCSAGAVTSAACVGIAMNNAENGQPVTYQDTGSFTVGATVVLGQPYVISGASGALELFADLTVGEYCTTVIVATSTSVATISITATAGVKA